MKNNIKGPILLFITAIIWGVAFVSQRSAASSNLGAFTFNGIRYLLGAIVLIPFVVIIRTRKNGTYNMLSVDEKKIYNKNTIIGGIVCGLFLCIASSFQQFGVEGLTSGKTGFITALYIIFVPLLGLCFKKKCSIFVFIAVPIALVGMYFLCMVGESFAITKYEIYVFLCAIFFTFQISAVDYFAIKVDCIAMACIEFTVTGLISLIAMFIFEKPEIETIKSCYVQILYSGIMSSGVAYTLQVVGQKHTNPTLASLIMSLESTISAIAGWIILKENLSWQQWLGCGIMFIAIIIAQIPMKNKKTGELNQ